jgi:tetratricopeptide (TPR) repeat protein
MGIFFSILLVVGAIIFTFIITSSGNKQKKAFHDAIATYQDHLINESIKKFQTLLYEEPYNALYHWYLALLSLQKQEYTNAEYHLQNILQIKNYTLPSDELPDIQNFNETGVRKRLVSIYETLKLKEKLIAEFEKLSTIEPENDAYPISIAELLLEEKDYSDRTQVYIEKTLKINPRNGRAQFLLSLVYLKNQKFDEALQSAEKTIAIDKSISDAFYIIGYVRYRLNLKEEAEKYFREAALCKYFRKSNAFYLAKILSSLGKLDFALSYAKEAVKYSLTIHEDPALDIDSRYLLATFMEQNDEFNEAIELYKYIANIQPGYQDVAKRLKYMSSAISGHEKPSAHIKADHLELYKNMRLDDFSRTSEKIMENLGYKIKKVDIVNDQTLNMIVIEQSGSQEEVIGVFVRRGIGILQEDHIKNIIRLMAGMQVNSAFLITPNDFNPNARKFAEKNAIKTINSEKLRELLKNTQI